MSAEDQSLLLAPPGDGISDLCFSSSSSSPSSLLVSSWDSTTRLYDALKNKPLVTFNYKAASLACCFQNDDVGFGGGVGRTVNMLDFQRGTTKALLTHDEAVSCMEWSSSIQALYTGSWDRTMSVHDPRAQQDATRVQLPGKVYSLSLNANKVVVATSERHIMVYDIRNLQTPLESRESPLKFQTRTVSCFLDGSGFAVGSIEGRVAVEYFAAPSSESATDGQPSPKSGYAFKCHRRGEVAYPVNDIAFHPIYGTFCTGGCDGTVAVWDGFSKKKLCQYHQYPASISSLSFSQDGSMLAIASSYTFEEGERNHAPDDNVFIRQVKDSDVKPKPRASN